MLKSLLIIFFVLLEAWCLFIAFSARQNKIVSMYKLNKAYLGILFKFLCHPIRTIKIIICFSIYILISLSAPIVGLLTFVYLLLPVLIPITIAILCFIYKINIIISIIACIASFFILLLSLSNITKKITDVNTNYIFYETCYLRQLFKNIFVTEYEKAFKKPISEKISAKEWVAYKKKRDQEEQERKEQEKADKDKEIKSKPKHVINELDLYYKNELILFDLYEQDFTLDDLKKKKNGLLKIWHPDNTNNKDEIEKYTKETEKIISAYNKVRKAYIEYHL